jgi:phytoene desaturase
MGSGGACVIGAGLGGLALAIRLQAAGIATTLIEARDKPGGRARAWRRHGFTFDAGPAAIADPARLRALWELTGHDMADDVELLPVSPLCRFNWPDGTSFEYTADEGQLRREVARIAPGDVAGFEAFLRRSAELADRYYLRLGTRPSPGPPGLLRLLPELARERAWQSLYGSVSRFVTNAKLREALSVPALAAGANPLRESARYASLHAVLQRGGLWWPRGGSERLAAAMARHFERLGGELRLHDAAVRIAPRNRAAGEVETRSGWRGTFAAIASNADVVHTYRDLLGHTPRGRRVAHSLARKRFAPAALAVHFGIEGSWPGIPHQMVLFGPRFRGLLDDIDRHGVLPGDFLISLHHPSVTDASLAPEGKSTFAAWIPAPHLGKLAADWQQLGPMLEQRILDEVGRRLIPDIHDRVVTRFHSTPRDFAGEFSAHLGSQGLEAGLLPRPDNRDAAIGNLYLVGAGTHPGPGVPAVLAGAKITADLMLRDLAA